MATSMHINEILERLNDDDGPYEWIHPKDIEGLKSDEIFNRNRTEWFSIVNVDDISDTYEAADETITDYLIDCYTEQAK